VNIHYLYGPGTLDEYIWPKIQGKLNIISGTLDNNQNIALDSFLNPENCFGMGDFDPSENSGEIDGVFGDEFERKRISEEVEDFDEEDYE